jgi:hypothetical protein
MNILVDITFVIPKLFDGVPSHAKGAWRYLSHWFPNEEEFPRKCGQEDQRVKEVKHEKYSPQNCPFWIYIYKN